MKALINVARWFSRYKPHSKINNKGISEKINQPGVYNLNKRPTAESKESNRKILLDMEKDYPELAENTEKMYEYQ